MKDKIVSLRNREPQGMQRILETKDEEMHNIFSNTSLISHKLVLSRLSIKLKRQYMKREDERIKEVQEDVERAI